MLLGAPNHRFVRVGKALAAKVGHRIGFDPNDVVEQPEAEILKCRANAEYVVIRANYPQRAIWLQDALRRLQVSKEISIEERDDAPARHDATGRPFTHIAVGS